MGAIFSKITVVNIYTIISYVTYSTKSYGIRHILKICTETSSVKKENLTGKFIFSFTSVCYPLSVTPVFSHTCLKKITFVYRMGIQGAL